MSTSTSTDAYGGIDMSAAPGTAMPDRASMAAMNRNTARRAADARMAREGARNVAPEPEPMPGQHPRTPSLADLGDIGAQVLDLVRLDKVDGMVSRALARVDEECRELAETARRDSVAARTTAAATAALDAAAKREKVPPTLAPLIHWDAHERTDAVPLDLERGVRTAIETAAADRALAGVRGVLDEVDALVVAAAHEVLADAVQAYTRLDMAGVGVDVTLDAAVDNADDGVLTALRLWRSASERWGQVQGVRMWCGAVLARGFVVRRGVLSVTPPPRTRSGAYLADVDARAANGPQAEAVVAGVPWQGSTVSSGVDTASAHAVLRAWCALDEHERPAPRGVADLDDVIGAARG